MYNTIIELKKQAVDILKKITVIQKNCKHTNAIKSNKASTGNWDKFDDCYWRECYCPDCDKTWIEDQ